MIEGTWSVNGSDLVISTMGKTESAKIVGDQLIVNGVPAKNVSDQNPTAPKPAMPDSSTGTNISTKPDRDANLSPSENNKGIRSVVQQGQPTALGTWALLVQRKVERYWQVPEDLRLDSAENEALVSFWVDRNGNLIKDPIVSKPASAPELGESGIRAIRRAIPFPPLPDNFKAMEQEVVLGFQLTP